MLKEFFKTRPFEGRGKIVHSEMSDRIGGKARISNPMRLLRGGLPLVFLFVVSSCAMLGIYPAAEKEFRQGVSLFNRGQYREAIGHFEKATELDPEFGKAYLYLGRSHLNLGEWSKAIPPLRTAWRLSPDETKKQIVDVLLDALLGAASQEFKKGNVKASIGYLKEALELQPHSDQVQKELFLALMAYGNELVSEGNFTEAITIFSDAVGLNPKDINAHLGLARAFFKNGDLGKAMQTALEALRIAPSNDAVQSLLRELTK
jgi:tetratricopeptide (TPR) repeat protein